MNGRGRKEGDVWKESRRVREWKRKGRGRWMGRGREERGMEKRREEGEGREENVRERGRVEKDIGR